MTVVKIRWYGPYEFDRINARDIAYQTGIYAIYRVFGGKKSLLYIGKTGRSFVERMSEHNRDWIWDIRGTIQFHFGILEYPQGRKHSIQKLRDTESLLILWHSPPYNTSSKLWYRGRFDLEVINIGRRGLLDKKVTTDDLVFS